MMQRRVPGPFVARDVGGGTWQLTHAAGAEIFLRGTARDAAEILADAGDIAALTVEWRDEAVGVAITRPAGVRHFKVGSAVVHEPRALLYQALPLATFDADAKRFWRRVFALMRIPGGRFLLRFLARGKRGARRAPA